MVNTYTIRDLINLREISEKKLKLLGLGFNQLKDCEDIIEWFSELYVLDVSYNQIDTLDIFSDTIVKVDFRGNPVCLCKNFDMMLADMCPKAVSVDVLKELRTTLLPMDAPIDPVLLKAEITSIKATESLISDFPTLEYIAHHGLQLQIRLPHLPPGERFQH